MDVLREREVKDSLERQLQDEQKVRGEWSIPMLLPNSDETFVFAVEKSTDAVYGRLSLRGRILFTTFGKLTPRVNERRVVARFATCDPRECEVRVSTGRVG